MKREIVVLGNELLAELTSKYNKNTEYKHISNIITGADAEDGGADHVVVFERLADNKFFQFLYTDWDLEHNFEDDFPDRATEVFPRQVMITVYE